MSELRTNRRMLMMAALAAFIGVAGGAAAWVLLRLIRLITNVALYHQFAVAEHASTELDPGWWILIPAVLGAIAISLLARWAPVIRGHGIPEAMEAVMTRQSRLAPRTAIAKPISAAVAIGTGAPFGAEGPIIVTGGSIGSMIGQLLPVTPSERKLLLAAGAAAGMSATFGAPLAAVVLAIELLVFEFSARAFVPLVIASAVAGGMHAALFGAAPIFHVPDHDLAGLTTLPAFAIMGVACGLLAITISQGLFVIERGYRALPIGEFWHPVIGAIGFATIGVFVPRVLGVGYDVINDVLSARLAVSTVALIAVAKLAAWWLALGSGTSGGTLAPVLLISSSFGLVVGTGLNQILPGPDVAPGVFALVAMAATFGAATQATFTAIVFVFELTHDYRVMLPLMLATVIADLVYRSTMDDSLMTEKLRRRGLSVGRRFEDDPFRSPQVAAIMSSDVATLPVTATLGEARRLFTAGDGHGAYPLVDDDRRMVGIVTRGDALRSDAGDDTPVSGVASLDVLAVGPGDRARRALDVMVDEQIEHVPVIDDTGRLIGICTRSDLLRVRRDLAGHERPQVGLLAGSLPRRSAT